MVQWLRLHTANAGVLGSISGWGTKIPHALHTNERFFKEKKIYLRHSQLSSCVCFMYILNWILISWPPLNKPFLYLVSSSILLLLFSHSVVSDSLKLHGKNCKCLFDSQSDECYWVKVQNSQHPLNSCWFS